MQWGTYTSNKGFRTVTFPIAFTSFVSVIKSSAYRGDDSTGEERYITWQSLTQFRCGNDVGGANWIAVGK